MDTNVFVAFVIATAIMIALPGPSVLLTVAHSITFGWKSSLLTVLGATTGIAIQLLFASIGLSSLLHVASEIFSWLCWIGAGYLVYLGIKQWQSANKPFDFDAPQTSKINLFAQGIVVTVPNPKSLVFIAAFLPQFIDVAKPTGLQFAIIVPTFLLITFSVTSIWAIAAGRARTTLKKGKRVQTVMRTAGGLMVMAGLGMALARRSS